MVNSLICNERLPKQLNSYYENVEPESDVDEEFGRLLNVVLGNASVNNVNFEIIDNNNCIQTENY